MTRKLDLLQNINNFRWNTSMKYVLANPKKYGLHEAVKIADANVGMSAGFKTISLYALGFIDNNKEMKILQQITAN